MSIGDVVQSYLTAGLCVLPADLIEKRPALSTWKTYQSRLPTAAQVASWFAKAAPVCVLTGATSGNLEVIDFDLGGELFAAWRDLVESQAPGISDRCLIERSQSRGRHIVYRCETPVPGSQKLAQRRMEVPDASPVTIGGKTYIPRKVGDRFEVIFTLIETRGEGGLILCAPSPGYVIEQGGFNQLPVITETERSILISAASSLTEVYEPDPPAIPAQPAWRPDPSDGGMLPGDDFNQRGDVREILVRHGWQLVRAGENEQWRRPGKSYGASATLKDRVFYVFSSNALPFQPARGYSPFSVYALLEHAGDFSAAASALAGEGFGCMPMPTGDVDLSNLIKEPHHQSTRPFDDFCIKSVDRLVADFPELRQPVIHGLLREGETMNVIASPKVGKSWMVIDLALTVATGGDWLGTYKCERGDVLIIDNELHCETSANRIPKVMQARGIAMPSIRDRVFVANVRGSLRDIHAMGRWFAGITPGRFKMIVLDAFYRFMPKDTDENDNGAMASVYNTLDSFAARLGCSFVLVHHASKGNQSGKSVTDVGAGAGSQSRATDTHLVLRPHATDDVVVLDAAVRSWPPVPPRCLRWAFPVWTPDDSLDPTELRQERPRRAKEPKPAKEPAAPAWNVKRFVETFISDKPVTIPALRAMTAERPDLSWRHAADLIEFAEAEGLIERQKLPGRGGPVALVLARRDAAGGER